MKLVGFEREEPYEIEKDKRDKNKKENQENGKQE